MATYGKSVVNITGSTFTNNKAQKYGGVIVAPAFPNAHSSFSSTFIGNSATNGGAMSISARSSLKVTNSTFTSNSAAEVGGAIWCSRGSVTIDNSWFGFNAADSHGGIMFTTNCFTFISNSTFAHNLGSLYLFGDNLTFEGHTKFEHSTYTVKAEDVFFNKGGAITSFQSTVIFQDSKMLVF